MCTFANIAWIYIDYKHIILTMGIRKLLMAVAWAPFFLNADASEMDRAEDMTPLFIEDFSDRTGAQIGRASCRERVCEYV